MAHEIIPHAAVLYSIPLLVQQAPLIILVFHLFNVLFSQPAKQHHRRVFPPCQSCDKNSVRRLMSDISQPLAGAGKDMCDCLYCSNHTSGFMCIFQLSGHLFLFTIMLSNLKSL